MVIEHVLWLIASFVMGGFGWYIHLNRLMAHIEAKRGRPTTVSWFRQNRRRKFNYMIATPVPLIFIQYLAVLPPDIDMTTIQGRAVLCGYLASVMVTGAGSNKILDKYITDSEALTKVVDDGDDYSTRSTVKVDDK